VVPKVDEFLRVEPNVLEGIEQDSPYLTDAVVTLIDGVRVGEQLGGLILDGGIVASYEQVEVSTVRRRVILANTPGEDHATQPRVSGQSCPRASQPTAKRREADDDPFIQGPVPPRNGHERDSSTSYRLNDLLRHRPQYLAGKSSAQRATRRAESLTSAEPETHLPVVLDRLLELPLVAETVGGKWFRRALEVLGRVHDRVRAPEQSA
jgi:hypothetical protein